MKFIWIQIIWSKISKICHYFKWILYIIKNILSEKFYVYYQTFTLLYAYIQRGTYQNFPFPSWLLSNYWIMSHVNSYNKNSIIHLVNVLNTSEQHSNSAITVSQTVYNSVIVGIPMHLTDHISREYKNIWLIKPCNLWSQCIYIALWH